MNRRMPSLHLLRVFDAAGRRLSFKDAAEELHVTPSAVSHQVKTLEEQLGFALFQRGNRTLQLTEGGRAYLRVVSKSLTKLYEGTEQVLRNYGQSTLRISLAPPIARHVVIPALKSFQKNFPQMKLRIETEGGLADFRYEDVDLAVRYGFGDWPDVYCEKFFGLVSTAVCSNDFVRKHQLTNLEQIRELPVIQMSFFPGAWEYWSKTAGLAKFKPADELWLDSYEACVEAAEAGLGFALGLLPLERPVIEGGKLVAPFDVRIPNPQSVYLVCRHGDEEREDLRLFSDWLKGQFVDPPTANTA